MPYRRPVLSSAVNATLEQLEERRHLSSAINASKILVVTGTSSADTISIEFTANRIVLRDNGAVTKYVFSAMTGISISTLAGNDTVTLPQNLPGFTSMEINTGDGSDTVTGSNLGEKITLGAGNDTANGNGGDDAIFGQDGNDVINAGDGNSDRVYPGLGNDTVSGGTGTFDTLTYQDRNDGVTVRIDGGGPSGNLTAAESDTVANDFENAVGGLGNDLVIGNAGANVIGGSKGDDTLDGGLGKDQIFGDEGIDTVTYASRTIAVKIQLPNASSGNGQAGELDQLFTLENAIGGKGNDAIYGDILANSIVGGDGNDYIDAGDGNDTVEGGNGRDYIIAGPGTNRVRGGGHNDTIIGGPHRDVIYGDGGDDSILSGKGNDYISGGTGADIIDGGVGTDSSIKDTLDTVTNVETLLT